MSYTSMTIQEWPFWSFWPSNRCNLPYKDHHNIQRLYNSRDDHLDKVDTMVDWFGEGEAQYECVFNDFDMQSQTEIQMRRGVASPIQAKRFPDITQFCKKHSKHELYIIHIWKNNGQCLIQAPNRHGVTFCLVSHPSASYITLVLCA